MSLEFDQLRISSGHHPIFSFLRGSGSLRMIPNLLPLTRVETKSVSETNSRVLCRGFAALEQSCDAIGSQPALPIRLRAVSCSI